MEDLEDGALEAVSGKTGIFSFISMEGPDNFILHMEEGALETPSGEIGIFSSMGYVWSNCWFNDHLHLSSLLIFVGQTNKNGVYAPALSIHESIIPGIAHWDTNIFNPNPWVTDCLSY